MVARKGMILGKLMRHKDGLKPSVHGFKREGMIQKTGMQQTFLVMICCFVYQFHTKEKLRIGDLFLVGLVYLLLQMT